MAVSKGNRKQKLFVKVFYVNPEDLEEELNDWLNIKGKYYEVIDIELSSSQSKSVLLILYRELD